MTRFGLFLIALAACGPKESAGPPVGISDPTQSTIPDRPVTFVFDSLDDRPVSSDWARGKPTVLAIVTTGDLMGQAQVDYLVPMSKRDAGRVNYALVALHPRREIVLVDTYVQTLKVEFPTALADPEVIAGPRGPFGDIVGVPTIVVLDRDGRITWKHTGLAKPEEIRNHIP